MRVEYLLRYSLLAAGLLLCQAGCQVGDRSETGGAGKPLLITATVRGMAEVEQLIASQAGKVVVVHLWALW